MSSLNYTTIHHETRKSLGLSANEYMVADLIYNLQNNQKSKFPGWCFATRQKMSEMLGLSKRGMLKIIGRLIESELIKKDGASHRLKTSQEWYNKVVYINTNGEGVNNVHPQSEQRSPSIGTKCTSKPGSYNNNYNNNYNPRDKATEEPLNASEETMPADDTIGSLENVREILEVVRNESGIKIRETPGKIKSVRTRLKIFTKEEIIKAVKNTFANEFYSGKNDRGWTADFEYMFRNDEVMEKLLNMKPGRQNVKILIQE